MKHFPSIMFHPDRQSLTFRYLRGGWIGLVLILLSSMAVKAAEPLPYAVWFNPEKGFKPAQRSLTDVFLQMAGSFEYYGTPEPYLRHVMAEHARIDAKYKQATGKGGSSRPVYLTDAYVDNLLAGWNQMAPILTLESLTKQSGRNMRHAIMGSWNKSVDELADDETKLSEKEKAVYVSFLKKDYFKKADFDELEKFYSVIWDKLTDDGKAQISKRTWRGTQTPEKRAESISTAKGGSRIVAILNSCQTKSVACREDGNAPKAGSEELETALVTQLRLHNEKVEITGLSTYERDALVYSHEIRAGFMKRINHVRNQAKLPGQAESIVKALIAMPKELVVIARMEFELGLDEAWADRRPGSH